MKLVLPKSNSDDDNEEDGFVMDGDIGEWQADASLKLIDRKKNIFKLSQGEFVAIETLENVYGLVSNLDSGMVTCSGSLRSGWLTNNMVHSIKYDDQVLNSKPVSEFNPSIGHVVKSVVDTPKDVTDKVSAENECVQFVCLV
nr:long chain acyl-CoA synthetase 4 isoform X1 [Tanacetum cinerariifolium]